MSVIDLSMYAPQQFKINFSEDLSPPSKYIAPTKASKQSLIILSVDPLNFYVTNPNKGNF